MQALYALGFPFPMLTLAVSFLLALFKCHFLWKMGTTEAGSGSHRLWVMAETSVCSEKEYMLQPWCLTMPGVTSS